MKNISIRIIALLLPVVLMFSCKDFDDINVNPTAANVEQVQVEYFINNSIIGAQQNPHIAERVFVLYWKDAGRMDRLGTLSEGSSNDGWTHDYFNSYLSTWLRDINSAISVSEEKEKLGTLEEYSNNLLQVARIWRVYLMSEGADNFGPMSIDGFKGVDPNFSSVKDVYMFMLSELKDATSKIDTKVTVPDNVQKEDPAYGYNFEKWLRYGNSLRMRLAMRLSEVDASTAQTHFEEAANGSKFISKADETFSIQEKPGWDQLTGVMSREWNMQKISTTLNNLYVGIGGVKSARQLAGNTSALANIKDADWMGVQYKNQFTTKTNDPSAGYWFDGLPQTIDPRAYKAFIIPGDLKNPEFNRYPSWAKNVVEDTKRVLMKNKKDTLVEIDAAFTWNAPCAGDWGAKGSLNKVVGWPGAVPRLANKFRNSTAKRIFFASWETYFLIAEAAVRGWSVPLSGQDAYERGIKESFEYWGVSEFYSDYIASEDYSRTGTSVKWGHIAEPPSNVTMKYKDGYTGDIKTVEYKYPKNSIYKNGAVRNDYLTKIITQKFIAQVPWLPLETWSDHRRLGLPFFENPAVELPIQGLPGLNDGTYMECRKEFYPQRIPYPTSLKNNIPKGYEQAVGQLGGADEIFTPLWWAK